MRILLVDDDREVLSAVRQLLQRRGADVFVAITVDEARSILKTVTLDAVVSDWDLTRGQCGADVLAATAQAQPDCLRVVLSGRAPQPAPDGLIHAWLRKPALGGEVLAALAAQSSDRRALQA